MTKGIKLFICILLAFTLTVSAISCGAGGKNKSGSSDGSDSGYQSDLSEEDSSDGSDGGSEIDEKTYNEIVSLIADNYSAIEADFYITNKKDGKSEQILLEDMRNFLSLETTEEIAVYLYNHYIFDENNCLDKSAVSLTWEDTSAESYTVYISDNVYFDNAATVTSATNSCDIGFLIPGEIYFYKVADSDGKQSDIDFFKVSDEFSVRYISAGAYVSNMRDLGGWKTDSGKTVKYGMIYRSGHFDDMEKDDVASAYGKHIIKDILGVKTEIDLRNSSNRPGKTLLGADNFIEYPMAPYSYIFPGFYYHAAIDGKNYQYWGDYLPSIKGVFDTFADINNYPIDYHCAAGADRTGTISFLLNGLLGVSYEDLACDYELTSFSKQERRWRSNVVAEELDENGRMISGDFDDLGVMEVVGSYFGFGKMFDDMMSLYGTGDNKLSSAIANYLTTVCGVSTETLNKIKEIMLY